MLRGIIAVVAVVAAFSIADSMHWSTSSNVPLEAFGGRGGGLAFDNTDALARAATRLGAGDVLLLDPRKIYFTTSFPQFAAGVTIDCGHSAVGLPEPASSANIGSVSGGAIVLAAKATVYAVPSGAIRNCYLLNESLRDTPSNITEALKIVRGYSGTAITVERDVHDFIATNLMIVGFSQAIVDRAAVGRNRYTHLKIDSHAGIAMTGANSDLNYLVNVEIANFLVPVALIASPNDFMALYRPGSALSCQSSCQSLNASALTTVGYQTGIDIDGSSSMIYAPRFSHFHIDGYTEFVELGVRTVGVQLRSSSNASGSGVSEAVFSGGGFNAQYQSIDLGPTPPAGRMSATFVGIYQENATDGVSVGAGASITYTAGASYGAKNTEVKCDHKALECKFIGNRWYGSPALLFDIPTGPLLSRSGDSQNGRALAELTSDAERQFLTVTDPVPWTLMGSAMLGIGAQTAFQPGSGSTVCLMLSFQGSTASGSLARVQPVWGTGPPPAYGASPAGTEFGPEFTITSVVAGEFVSVVFPYCLQRLDEQKSYWLDLKISAGHLVRPINIRGISLLIEARRSH